VANYDYLRCKTVDDAIAGDWVVAMHPTSGVFFNVPAAAGTYTKGQPLSIANGFVKAKAAGESVRAYVEEDRAYTIATAGDLCASSLSKEQRMFAFSTRQATETGNLEANTPVSGVAVCP
jgi:hypothetical protein